ncbi:uncharacterized protein LOC134530070 [Bacillus rossius redtenbacheri]|uniref:uncharacterized protein LOC134530070 n=1 Tax=Bacillus rossius redtenbacheri TaxID=93214 RepID=UPI002FDEDB90
MHPSHLQKRNMNCAYSVLSARADSSPAGRGVSARRTPGESPRAPPLTSRRPEASGEYNRPRHGSSTSVAATTDSTLPAMRTWTLLAVAVLVLATWSHVSEALCPHCTCPAQYELV